MRIVIIEILIGYCRVIKKVYLK